MIDVWCIKAWNGLSPARQKLTTKALGFIKSLPSKRTGIVLTIAVPLLVIMWHMVALGGRPSHLNEIVDTLGSTSIGTFFQNPMPNNASSRLLFVQNAENGYDLFFVKIGDSHRKVLFEETYKQTDLPTEKLLGWSPDDRFFAYARRSSMSWQIVICDGDTGETLATLPVDSSAISGAWLSPQTFVFASQNNVLFTIENSQGKWLSPKPFHYFLHQSNDDLGPIRNLTAFNEDSVVWCQGDAIWSCSENSDVPEEVWNSTTNTLLEFSYSQATRKFLLHCADANGQFLMAFSSDQPAGPAAINRITASEYNATNLTFINNGKGYAFMTQVGTSNALVINLDSSRDVAQFQWFDHIKGFATVQGEVFVTGSRDNMPIGIHEYDLASGVVECVVPKTEENFYYWTNCPVERDQITNESGATLTYYMYEPPSRFAKKEHPLIVGLLYNDAIGFQGFATDEAFANCGYDYVYVDHYQRDASEWSQDALTVYEKLAKRADIDTNNVYLYGVSAGVGAVYELLKEHPELWRGAVLFSPGGFPDPSRLSGKRLFIDCGGKDYTIDKENSEIPTRFQDRAADEGIPVTLLVHPGLSHSLNRLPQAEQERMREALIFLREP